MGCHENIDYDRFPRQGDGLNKKAKVCFNYNSSKWLNGIVVRDDYEAPFTTLIQLEDGRVVNADECQYQPEHLWIQKGIS